MSLSMQCKQRKRKKTKTKPVSNKPHLKFVTPKKQNKCKREKHPNRSDGSYRLCKKYTMHGRRNRPKSREIFFSKLLHLNWTNRTTKRLHYERVLHNTYLLSFVNEKKTSFNTKNPSYEKNI